VIATAVKFRRSAVTFPSIRRVAATAAIGMLSVVAAPAAAGDASPNLDFAFTRLATLGGTDGGAAGINDRGDIVGDSRTVDGVRHATLWSRGRVVDLGVGSDSLAFDINDNEAIVGVYNGQGFLWRRGVVETLPYLYDWGAAWASAINDEGTIAGTDETYPVLWTKTIEAKLRPPVPSTVDHLNGINNRGQAVGCSSENYLPGDVATLYTHSGSRVLPSAYGGSDPGACAVSINNHRQVAGYSWPDAGDRSYHATRWDHDQPVLLDSGDGTSTASAINDDGWVVGTVSERGGSAAVLWVGRHLVRLNQFLDADLAAQGWRLTTASAVNNHGWIAGSMSNAATGERSAWVLTPR
jgi:probable HAF family extracellular repeat protein